MELKIGSFVVEMTSIHKNYPNGSPYGMSIKDRRYLYEFCRYGAKLVPNISNFANSDVFDNQFPVSIWKIAAIKKHRLLTNCGLKESKDFIDHMIYDICKKGLAYPENKPFSAKLGKWLG